MGELRSPTDGPAVLAIEALTRRDHQLTQREQRPSDAAPSAHGSRALCASCETRERRFLTQRGAALVNESDIEPRLHERASFQSVSGKNKTPALCTGADLDVFCSAAAALRLHRRQPVAPRAMARLGAHVTSGATPSVMHSSLTIVTVLSCGACAITRAAMSRYDTMTIMDLSTPPAGEQSPAQNANGRKSDFFAGGM